MLTIAKCRDLDYYEREVIDGREEYLSEDGASPGRWVGSLAGRDGLTGVADRDGLAAAFDGLHPGGYKLTAHETSVAGFDLTLSPSKSVSLIWALGADGEARQVEESLYAARAEVERYLEANACFIRRGHAGAHVEPGTGFMGAVFLHRTSRLGDPGIHLHWTVFNVAEGPDGRRTALDARALYRERYTAEAIFQATLRRELVTRLGLVFDEMDRHGVAEVVGISGDMRRAFSRRRVEIVAEMERLGLRSGDGARIAALTTRRAKPVGITEAELRAEWRQRAGDLRFDLSAVPQVPQAPKLRVGDEELAAELTEEHATFQRRDAVRAAARAARQGASLDEILVRAGHFLAGDQAIPLGDDRWTTPEILRLEQRVLELAARPADDRLTADRSCVAAAISARPSLNIEQRAMVETLCLDGRPLAVVIGRAGAGKTFTLDAVREGFQASGHRVIGISLAARAARELEAGSGIASSTAHSLHAAVATGRVRLRSGDVLVVDEAGMVGTRLLAAFVEEAATAKAKIVLVGDPKQLPPVEAGGLFAALDQRLDVIELTENRRQRDPEERAITAALRAGHSRAALERLDEHGHVTMGRNSDVLRDQMVVDWWSHRESGHDVVMGAVHRSDVRDLNGRAHAALEAAGQLGPLVAIVEEQRYCVGDRVLALKNRYDLGILNGDLGRITGADGRGVHIHSDNGRELVLPLDYLAEHVQHGYARTVHKTQGLTCEVALLLGDDTLYAELGYTGADPRQSREPPLRRGRRAERCRRPRPLPRDPGSRHQPSQDRRRRLPGGDRSLMRTQPQPTRGDDDVTIPATIIGIASGAGLLHWLAANLAGLLGRGRPLDANPIDAVVALVGLPDHASDPRLAWEEPARSNLPGPVVYWFAVAAVVLGAIVVAGVVARWLGERRHEPPDKRRRLGTETQAHLATTGDLRPLLTRRPVPERFVLARWGRRCLSTEGENNRHRRAVQGAVAVSDRPSPARRPG